MSFAGLAGAPCPLERFPLAGFEPTLSLPGQHFQLCYSGICAAGKRGKAPPLLRKEVTGMNETRNSIIMLAAPPFCANWHNFFV